MHKYFLIPCLCLALLAACATTRLEEDYGNSYRLAVQNQMLDPSAPKDLEPVTGLDNRAAAGAMKKYIESFEKEPEGREAYTLGVIRK